MKVTFLFGNGFDQGAGFATSYRNFYAKLLSERHRSTIGASLILHSIHHQPDSKKELWSDFESGLGAFAAEFTPKKLCSNLEDCGEFFIPGSTTPLDLFCQGCSFAKEMLRNYLKVESEKMDKKKLSFRGYSELFRLLSAPYTFIKGANNRALVEQQYVTHAIEDWEISILSFNYTDLLDRCIDEFAPTLLSPASLPCSHTMEYRLNKHVIHVHGTLGRFVCGVGDISQIKNRSFRTSADPNRFVKEYMVQSLGERWYADAVNDVNSSSIICIFGLSLGDTDIFWWKTIGVWLDANANNQLIIFDYTGDDSIGLADTLIDRCIETKKLFCKKSGLDYATHKFHIHVVPFCKNEIVQPSWLEDRLTP